MKMTLLEITQDILNDIDGDEVNSIDDTTESTQVAQIIKSTYFSLIDSRDWPHTRKLIQITASGTTDLPTYMYLPENVKSISAVNYNKAKASDGERRRFSPVKYLEPEDFLRRCNLRDNTQGNQTTITDPNTGVVFTIRTDIAPEYFTSFDDTTLVFDSYDSSVDDTLQKSKVQVYAYTIPSWTHTDTAIPDLPDLAFTLLLEEAKSRSSLKLRQQVDSKAEQESLRQRKWLSRKDKRIAGGIKFPDYGRNTSGIKYYRDPTFRRDYR